MKIPQKAPDMWEIVRRNPELLLMFVDPQMQDLVAKYNREYVHWEELRHRKLPVEAEKLWALIKSARTLQAKRVEFGEWTFRYVLSGDTLRRLHLLDTKGAGYLESGPGGVSVADRKRYIVNSLMEEAIASSQLEGAATTREAAKKMLRQERKPRDYSEKMIINGYQTMCRIAQMKTKSIDVETLLEIHREITHDTLEGPEHEGKFRDNNEIVVADPQDGNKVYHIPPDYQKIPSLMEEFCRFASNDEEDFIHPLIKGIILHFLIGYVHPFTDGNGRSARSIFYWYMLSRGYWLFEYMPISRILLRSKTSYSLAYLYTETDENDLTYFINYNLSAIEKALKDLEEYIALKKQENYDTMHIIETSENLNLRQADILKNLLKEPDRYFSIAEIKGKYNVAYDTARNDMQHLVKLGYVERIERGKSYMYRYKGVK
ncbi:MAG: Fic family protein [Methanolobus sp.]|uniref:Fic family protein n=1 Tax=Methanolobus sp. TaxID=1874737 RepID=UPI00272FDCEB|nr:Fic family protein [Methanolobus sp.]MDP2218168.1 Fic family protein [Methanolobus sp.]